MEPELQTRCAPRLLVRVAIVPHARRIDSRMFFLRTPKLVAAPVSVKTPDRTRQWTIALSI